ncbi:MAG: tRNA (N(6)-L-threonylcarbamoyladenosine(37)-C(2))-methylthiotransferase MtaB, partial [Nitrospinae bacterium]|nr:tRNA (N(6)-L-threonylcarbamoyladenosine(37)-C(2))-methylthiotransferase MtaB [Nitrospinota bacterium]
MKKVAFTTLGCRYNQFETAEMSSDLKEHNYEVVPFNSEADIYVINTCTVTGRSDLKCRNAIRRAVKEKGPEGKVIVVGCYPETNAEAILAIEGVDMVLGNEEKLNLSRHLKKLGVSPDKNNEAHAGHQNKADQEATKARSEAYSSIRRNDEPRSNAGMQSYGAPHNISSFSGRTTAYLKVQTGCDMNCSYCIVRVARGKGKSEPLSKVIERAEQIIKAGFREIVLTGINLGTYGKDLSPPLSLTDLIEEIIPFIGEARIRLSSMNPNEVSDSLISLMKDAPAICRHLHISLQSGSDTILKGMRRNYNSNLFEKLVNRLAKEIPDISIGTDIIVGFPGEMEEMFRESYNIIDRSPISYMHVFPFSARKGTDAASYKGQVKKGIKMERKDIILRLGEEKREKFMRAQLGKIGMVLFENKRDNSNRLLKGYTDNYIPVQAVGNDSYMNRILPVRLSRIEGENIVGAILEVEK